MEGKRDGEGIRKGPWKAEEDEVLLNHVKRCGPRDWSSIRSKGLLQRTGKSCRLRWVNKLRPNLKNGCKFSLDEERVVIELQAQFGNKWARIATYLPGRTDNDVKNFWSSRQKRLARILHTSAANTPVKTHKTKREVPVYHDEVPNLEAHQRENGKHFFLNEVPKFSCSSEGESTPQASSCSSPCIENSDSFKIRQLPEVVDPKLLGLEVNPVQDEPVLNENSQWSQPQALIPFVQNRQPQTDLGFSLETQELMKLDDQYFDMLLPLDDELYCGELPVAMQAPFLEPVVICGNAEGEEIDNTIGAPNGGGFDDFPAHIYDDDQVEPQPNPSEHSSSVDVKTRD